MSDVTQLPRNFEMGKGAIYADKVWNQVLRFNTKGFIVGFFVRLFAFYAAATSPKELNDIFAAIQKA